MLDPNLNIWALLLCTYVLYGLGYMLGLTQSMNEDDKPGLFELCVTILCAALVWPFIKGAMDGVKQR